MAGSRVKLTEAQYRSCLRQARRLFAWCLVRYGRIAPSKARARALALYPYEPADRPLRDLVFHNTAWEWAMHKLYGPLYWKKRPALSTPSAEYEAEANKPIVRRRTGFRRKPRGSARPASGKGPGSSRSR